MPKAMRKKAKTEPLPAAPIEFAGQWVAWNKQQTKIVAHGFKIAEVHQAALAAGHPKAIFQKVPESDVYFVGAS
jgi:hypothetical protein